MRNSKMMIKGIIFDVDGVIFDSEKLHLEAWKKVFRKRNIFLKDEQSGVGYSDREFLLELKAKGIIPPDINIREIQEEKLSELIELADKDIQLFSGVKELLSSLKNRYLFCVASNSDRKFISKILKNTNLISYFKYITTVNDVQNPKPHPDIYILSAKRMGLEPNECVVIEDSSVGVEAAKRAEMKCIAVAHSLPKEKLQKADLILEQISTDKIIDFIRK